MSDARNPDRLGDAIRELTRTMAETGRRRLLLHVRSPEAVAVYEISLRARIDRKDRRARRLIAWHHGGENTIEVEAFGPAPDEGARQMADSKKE